MPVQMWTGIPSTDNLSASVDSASSQTGFQYNLVASSQGHKTDKASWMENARFYTHSIFSIMYEFLQRPARVLTLRIIPTRFVATSMNKPNGLLEAWKIFWMFTINIHVLCKRKGSLDFFVQYEHKPRNHGLSISLGLYECQILTGIVSFQCMWKNALADTKETSPNHQLHVLYCR